MSTYGTFSYTPTNISVNSVSGSLLSKQNNSFNLNVSNPYGVNLNWSYSSTNPLSLQLASASPYSVSFQFTGNGSNNATLTINAFDGFQTYPTVLNIYGIAGPITQVFSLITITNNTSNQTLFWMPSSSATAYTIQFTPGSNNSYISSNIIPNNTLGQNSLFGYGAGISGDGSTMIVGAPGYNSSLGYAAIYTYQNLASVYNYYTNIIPNAIFNSGSLFGQTAAINQNGTVAVIGAPRYNSSAGSAVVYTQINGNWNITSNIFTSATGTGSLFGSAVAISGDGNTVLIGASNTNSTTGYAVSYSNLNGNWNTSNVISSNIAVSGPGSQFGKSVAINYNGTVAVIGAPGSNSGTGSATVYNYSPASGGSISGINITLNNYIIPNISGVSPQFFGTQIYANYNTNTLLVSTQMPQPGYFSIYTYSANSWNLIQNYSLNTIAGTTNANFQTGAISSDGNTIIISYYTNQGYVQSYNASSGWNIPYPLTNSDPNSNDQYGTGLALNNNGTIAIVGNNGGGYIAVYSFNGTSWLYITQLTNTYGFNFLNNIHLSLDGNTLLVPYPQYNNFNGGAVVYKNTSTSWSSYSQTIVTTTIIINGQYGPLPAGLGNTAAISGDGNTIILQANGNSQTGYFVGSRIVIFTYNTTWSVSYTLIDPYANASSQSTIDNFGISLALNQDGTIAVIGNPQNQTTNTDQVYILIYINGNWNLTTTINSPFGTNALFGQRLNITNSALLIAAQNANSTGEVVYYNYTTTTSGGTSAGWNTSNVLTNNAGANSAFGGSVSISSDGNTVLVGASNASSGTGYAAIYTYSGSTWNSPVSLTNNAGANSRFGQLVSLSQNGTTAYVSAPGYTSGSGSGYVAQYTYSNATWNFTKAFSNIANGNIGFGNYSIGTTSNGYTSFISAPNLNTNTGIVNIYTNATTSNLGSNTNNFTNANITPGVTYSYTILSSNTYGFGYSNVYPYPSLSTNIMTMNYLSSAAVSSMNGIYAMKQVLSSYTGPIFNLQRQSDNTTLNFYTDSNGNYWSGPNGTGQSLSSWSGGQFPYITTWYDQSGKGNNAFCSFGNQPQLYYDSIAGYVVNMQFTYSYFSLPGFVIPSGDSSYTISFKNGSLWGSSPNTNILVYSMGDTNNNGHLNACTISTDNSGIISTTQVWYNEDLTATLPGNINNMPQNAIITNTYQTGGGTRSTYFQGKLINSSSGQIRSSSIGPAYIGNSSYGYSYYNHSLKYFCVFSTVLSANDQALVENQ